MSNNQLLRIKTITEYHRIMGLPKPGHPLVSVIDLATIAHESPGEPVNLVFDFYSISLKRNCNVKFKYGQQLYDFDEGVMFFIAPGQVFGIETDKGVTAKRSGWILLMHPDFLWNSPLAKTIKRYEYFSYSVHEALFLSDKEESMILGIMQQIDQEYRTNIDQFSQGLIIAQLELLLNYSDRFYHRQFITRQITNHKLLDQLEELLNDHFNSNDQHSKGLPTVLQIAAELNVSPNYLSSMLKALTGQSTQQHIHDKLIEKAKERLSTTNLSVSEIAYELGFEHPQSFSKLFKTKTRLSPGEFRGAFN